MPWSRRRRVLAALILLGSMSAGTAACSPTRVPTTIGESPASGPAPTTSSPTYSPSSSPAPSPATATLDATTPAAPTSAATPTAPTSAATPTAPTSAATPTSPTTQACDQEGALIAQAVWITVEGQDSLEVTPTALLRTCPQVSPAWVELVELVPGADTPGMAEQFRCHVLFAPGKDVWHLEPWRPVVDGAEMIRTRCNPGAPDPDQP